MNHDTCKKKNILSAAHELEWNEYLNWMNIKFQVERILNSSFLFFSNITTKVNFFL